MAAFQISPKIESLYGLGKPQVTQAHCITINMGTYEAKFRSGSEHLKTIFPQNFV